MSGANYEWCPGCDQKALYVGEEDVPDLVEVWHESCRKKAEEAAATAERSRILDLLDNWKCSCGEDDCSAYDARDEIASVIEGANRPVTRTSKEGAR